MVFVWQLTLGKSSREEWVQIEPPFGELGKVDLRRALQRVGSTVCGGLALVQNFVTLRQSVPLVNLNINEFERPVWRWEAAATLVGSGSRR